MIRPLGCRPKRLAEICRRRFRYNTRRLPPLPHTAVPYCQVALNVPLDKLLTYRADRIPAPGTRVAVPFRGKTVAGIVWGACGAPEISPAKILPLAQVFADEPPLPAAWRELIDFTARYYHYPVGQTVFTALPAGLREAKPCPLPPPEPCFALTELGRQQPTPPPRHRRQAALWQALLAAPLSRSAARAIAPQAAAQLAAWQAQGWLAAEANLPAARAPIPPSPVPLNPEQQAAADAVAQAQGFAPFLLHGITGSGKTDTYFEAMAAALSAGKQVLFLLPEISLTPQLLARLQQRFAEVPTAVLHSQTAAGERTRGYLKAMAGQVRLVVGTRLAVFTPLPDLGLIVVDEEHDASFKQDSELRYHARDLAVWRARQAACPIMLGSATPSLESWHKAQSGAYRLLSLPQRARATARLPEIRLIDIRREPLDQGFCPAAFKLLRQNHAEGGMSMVYLNRRGFAPALFCGDCGHTFGCPHCSAKLVLHQRARQLRCHHCGLAVPIPKKCPDCGNQDLTAVGIGTQRVEEALRAQLPEAKIERVDRDSISRKGDWQRLYQRIAANGVDILVGTQMLAKGHDFARLNLVLVLNADGSLYSADFRAPERLFAELMQVAGRAGRAELPGRVFIQTRLPEHRVYQSLLRQDYPAFAEGELAERENFDMPPFTHTTAIRADAAKMADALELLRLAAEWVAQQGLPENEQREFLHSKNEQREFRQNEQSEFLRSKNEHSEFRQNGGNEAAEVLCLGPVPMLLAKLAGRERAQVFLESPSRKALHRQVSLWQQALAALARQFAAARWSVDIDPLEM
nr:primosomal protein N' [Eikenella glucosivorans]